MLEQDAGAEAASATDTGATPNGLPVCPPAPDPGYSLQLLACDPNKGNIHGHASRCLYFSATGGAGGDGQATNCYPADALAHFPTGAATPTERALYTCPATCPDAGAP